LRSYPDTSLDPYLPSVRSGQNIGRAPLNSSATLNVSDQYQCGVEGRLTQARLPWIQTLEQSDWEFQPSTDQPWKLNGGFIGPRSGETALRFRPSSSSGETQSITARPPPPSTSECMEGNCEARCRPVRTSQKAYGVTVDEDQVREIQHDGWTRRFCREQPNQICHGLSLESTNQRKHYVDICCPQDLQHRTGAEGNCASNRNSLN
jgi:hypothetical protein